MEWQCSLTFCIRQLFGIGPQLEGSWVALSRVISRLSILVALLRVVVKENLLMATPEPERCLAVS